MEAFGGLGSGVDGTRRAGMHEEEIRMIIVAELVEAIREVIPELFGLVKITLSEEFDRRYTKIEDRVSDKDHQDIH